MSNDKFWQIQANREKIYLEITEERNKQDAKWGGPDHDDQHGYLDWLMYIIQHVGKASLAISRATYRYQLIRIAALAVAAVEAFDRRHPDVAKEKTQ